MPVTVTFPGVYIEEIPSGVRTITGVATSITAFVGRALRGPVNEPVTINSFGDFERIFGGLSLDCPMSYAVQDFYLNGGAQALIVRLYGATGAGEIIQARLTLGGANALELEAANPGRWGNELRARVDQQVIDPDNNLFNLSIFDPATGVTEMHRNVAVLADSPRRVDTVLAQQSQLARVRGALPASRPDETPIAQPTENLFSDANSIGVEAGDEVTDANDPVLTTTEFRGVRANKTGIFALEKADLFNILCIPPYTLGGNVANDVWTDAGAYCLERRAFLLIDPPTSWASKDAAKSGIAGLAEPNRNAAVYFPQLRKPNALREGQLEDFAPSGAVAGVMARTDAQRGVWKAPAGLEATLVGVPQLSVPLTDLENGELNPLGVNCLRAFPAAGRVVWGARTRVGDDRLASEWKYVPVRRLALFIEESLYRGTQWVVFEPNDEPLWSQIRLNVGAFMNNLFRQGAFQGQTPREAYFVKCDKETTTQNDINLGIVNILVGFAPLKPAEFVIIKLQQMAGQVEA